MDAFLCLIIVDECTLGCYVRRLGSRSSTTAWAGVYASLHSWDPLVANRAPGCHVFSVGSVSRMRNVTEGKADYMQSMSSLCGETIEMMRTCDGMLIENCVELLDFILFPLLLWP